ncbi:hypothetical protein PIB30_100620, partial [Stylosanthes scabra]|nr:hypothetical protein [Stylosanthes scabra]
MMMPLLLLMKVLNLTPNLKLCLSSSTKRNRGVVLQKVEQRVGGWVGFCFMRGWWYGGCRICMDVGLGGMLVGAEKEVWGCLGCMCREVKSMRGWWYGLQRSRRG